MHQLEGQPRLDQRVIHAEHVVVRAVAVHGTGVIPRRLFRVEQPDPGERRLVARLVEGERRVIATGGGAFVDPATRALLKERAVTVWLDAPVEVLAERTGRRDTRPLLRGGNRAETLTRLDQERRPNYAEADIHVRSGTGGHGEVVEAIVAALRERLAR